MGEEASKEQRPPRSSEFLNSKVSSKNHASTEHSELRNKDIQKVHIDSGLSKNNTYNQEGNSSRGESFGKPYKEKGTDEIKISKAAVHNIEPSDIQSLPTQKYYYNRRGKRGGRNFEGFNKGKETEGISEVSDNEDPTTLLNKNKNKRGRGGFRGRVRFPTRVKGSQGIPNESIINSTENVGHTNHKEEPLNEEMFLVTNHFDKRSSKKKQKNKDYLTEPLWTLQDAIETCQKKQMFDANIEVIAEENELQVLPKKVLNNQTCTICLNYLSVGPVQVTKNHEIICGRKDCTKRNYFPSLYNEIAKRYYFNCINYYAGCNVVLQFSEKIEDHESSCKFKKYYNCLECNFSGNGCQLVQHYKKNHLNLFAEDGVFKIDQESMTKNILYVTNEYLIMIKLDIWANELQISCNMLNSNIRKYSLILFTPKTDICFVSKLIHFDTEHYKIDMIVRKKLESKVLFGIVRLNEKQNRKNETINELKPVAEVKDDSFTKALKEILKILSKININCCTCNNLISNKKEMFICPQSHFNCINCFDLYCVRCENECIWIDVKSIFENILLLCDWKNCKKQINCLDFINHKQICCKRDYQCPLPNCKFIGSSEELLNHWHDWNQSPITSGAVFNFDAKEFNNSYWIVDHFHELLHVKIIKIDGRFFLEIDETTAVFPNKYELELYSYHEGRKRYEKYASLIQKGKIKTYPPSLHGLKYLRITTKIVDGSLIADISENSNLKESNNVSAESVLKQLINIFFRLSLYCNHCKILMKDKTEIYICDQSHITCKHCSVTRCDSCNNDDIKFTNLNDIFKNLEFSCDWIGCCKKTNYWNFLQHKQICKMRQYDYETFTGTKEELLNNNQIKLKFGNCLDFQFQNSETIYWIAEFVNELLIVKLNDKKRQLKVKEDMTVFPNNYTIELYEYITSKMRYEKIEDLKQAGGWKKSFKNLSTDKSYRLAIVV